MKKEKAFSEYFMKNNFTFYLYYLMKTIHRFFVYYIIPDKIAIQNKFRKKMGYKLDLTNPVDFNEKLQWLKLYDRKKEYTECADKFKARNYIKKVLGEDAEKYLVPLVFHTKNVKDLRPENMPDYPVIIKTNHDQGGFKIIWDKNNVDWKQIQMFFKNRLKWNHYWNNREWPYKNVKRRIVVEKLMSVNGELPMDIKIYCFHGEVKFLQLAKLDVNGSRKGVFIDNKQQVIKNKIHQDNYYPELTSFPKPLPLFDELINIAKKISNQRIFLRVDLYLIDDNVYIGEMTFTPTAGFIKYFTPSFLKEIGSWLVINKYEL